MILRVFRWSPEAPEGRFEAFAVAPGAQATVLDALVEIRETRAPDLAFRYACRVGMCGSCTVVVDGQERWACRTRLSTLARPDGVVTVRPLYHFPLVRDLVVDLAPFAERMARVRAAFVPREDASDLGEAVRPAGRAESAGPAPSQARADAEPRPAARGLGAARAGRGATAGVGGPPAEGSAGAPGREMASAGAGPAGAATEPVSLQRGPAPGRGRAAIDAAIECIGCGACVSACTLVAWDARFPGPAALNRAFTLLLDPRDGGGAARLAVVFGEDGVWRCHGQGQCTEVCPMALSPTDSILRLRREALRAVARTRRP